MLFMSTVFSFFQVQELFVDYESSPDFPSTWGGDDIGVVFTVWTLKSSFHTHIFPVFDPLRDFLKPTI